MILRWLLAFRMSSELSTSHSIQPADSFAWQFVLSFSLTFSSPDQSISNSLS